jgi:uncharacterized membrane protein
MSTPTMRDTVKPLLLAPAGALTVVAVLLLFFDDDFGFSFPTLVLLAYFLIACYVVALLLVVPGLTLRPTLREPDPIAAIAFGMVIAWMLPLARFVVDGHGWESIGPATAAGAASGLLYSVLMMRR